MDSLRSFNPHLGQKDEFISANMGLVHFIAGKYRSQCNGTISYDDLAGEATVGLIKAYHQFDPYKNGEDKIKFATFACQMMRWEIYLFIRDKGGPIRPSSPTYMTAWKILSQELSGLTAAAIAEKLAIEEKLVKRSLFYLSVRQMSSLDQEIQSSDEEGSPLSDLIGKPDDLTAIHVSDFIERLSYKEREILLSRIEGKGQLQIAQEMNLSQSYISRLVIRIGNKALKYMGRTTREEKVMGEARTRKVTPAEAKQYGIKTVMDAVIEWYDPGASTLDPCVGINSNGFSFNAAAAAQMGLKVGGCMKIGIDPSTHMIVLQTAPAGPKIKKSYGNGGSVCLSSKRLGKWLENKRTARKRYELQYDDISGAFFVNYDLQA